MGRRAASIGASLGLGFSAGVSEKRRQLTQEKRDKELADAAMLRIAQQQKDSLALQANKDAIEDANIEAELLRQTQTNIPLMETFFPGSTKGITSLPDPVFKKIVGFKEGEIKRKQDIEIAKLKQSQKPPDFTPSQKDTLGQIRKKKGTIEKQIFAREKELRKISEDVISKTGRERVKTGGFLGFFQDEKLAQTDIEFLSSSLKSDSTLISLKEQLEDLSVQEEEITFTIKPGVLDGILKNNNVPDLKGLSIEELLELGRTP